MRSRTRSGLIVVMASMVLISAAGIALAGALPPGGTFIDDDGNTHEANIEAIVAEGITFGCDPVGPRYCPNDSVSRAQMASFLARALDLPATATDWFTDDDGNTHEANINKVAEAGITLGCGGALYCPSESVSRAQMASFLARALGLPDSGTDWFTDDDGNTHEANINKVAEAGITLGCGGALYCPIDSVSRAQMASFLARALGLEPMAPPPRPTTTTTTTSSATTTSTTTPSQTFNVSIGEFFFNPTPINISVGDSVRWTNNGTVDHTTTGNWDSENLSPGSTFTQTFDSPGTSDYICTIHPLMSGTVKVNP